MADSKNKPIVFGDFAGGLGLDYNTSNTGPLECAENQYSASNGISFFRRGKIGHIAPGEGFDNQTDGSSVITGLALNAATTSNGLAHIVTNEPKILALDLVTNLISLERTVALSGGHAAHSALSGTYSDTISYKNATNEYVLYSWQDNTDGDVGRMLLDGTSPNDNFFSGLTISAGSFVRNVPHVFQTGPDGIIYMTNGQYIASHDPNTTTVNYNALNLGFGWVASSLAVQGNYLVIVGYKATTYVAGGARSESKMWFWNGYAPDPNFIYSIGDNYCTAVINKDSELFAFTYGRQNTAKVRKFNPSAGNFATVAETTKAGGVSPAHGAVETYEDKVHWAVNGFLFCLDSYVKDGRVGYAIHARAALNNGTFIPTITGMVRNIDQSNLYVGAQSSVPAYKIFKINPTTYNTSVNLRTRLVRLPYRSNIERITVLFSQFAASSGLTVSLFKDFNTAQVGVAGVDLLNWSITTTTEPRVTTDMAVEETRTITDVSAFYLTLSFTHVATSDTAAIVRAVIVEYSPTDKG
jgi:hypothetical protein